MKSVMQHQFSQAPSAEIQRSRFDRSHGHKTTIDFDYLYPIYHDEVLPGDTFNLNAQLLARLNTPLYPIMDNAMIDCHFFFVPNRLIWENFRKFMGEQEDPGDSVDYTVPQVYMPASTGQTYSSTAEKLADHLGIPYGVPDIYVSALPFRAYMLIHQEWYRDQNLVTETTRETGDTARNLASNYYVLKKRGKRHDYFTSCLPWVQKSDGYAAYSSGVSIPLGDSAYVHQAGGASTDSAVYDDTQADYVKMNTGAVDNLLETSATSGTEAQVLYADLSTATAATINQLRQAFQIQKLLERDARSGTRYSEIVKGHFNVNFMDVTYRPEFLGGFTQRINVQQIAQTSNDGTNGNVGELAAYGMSFGNGGFTKSFTEHGIVMGIISARADLTYQQGVNRSFLRSTRFDYYWPSLSHIGEQSVTNMEIYAQDPTTDTGSTGTPDNEKTFGYQERYAEYRYKPSEISGKFRSANSSTLDPWHLSQEFSSLPTLNTTFIESTTPIDRVVAVTSEPDLIVDAYFDLNCVRPMPVYSVPGLIDHF
jgi:hypothetical protein